MIKKRNRLLTDIENNIVHLNSDAITSKRKAILQQLIDYIQSKTDQQEYIRLNFICTHNSRRSHFSQVWAQTAAHYYNVKNVQCYSGGTEATALFPMVAETLRHSGFKITQASDDNNPIYFIKFADKQHPIIGFSKKFDDAFNPQSDFAAIMTCSHADANCPFIAGAEQRIATTYNDPKESDNTPQQKSAYNESSQLIATEMFYVFSKIKV